MTDKAPTPSGKEVSECDVPTLSIKDFSKCTGLSEPTLRYYDKIGLLSPAVRGENRYRYYTPHQVMQVNFIKALTTLGVPLSSICDLNRNRTPRTMLTVLAQQQKILNKRLFDIQTAYSILHAYHGNIQTGIFAHEHDIFVRELDEARIMLGQENDFSSAGTFHREFINFCLMAQERGINLHYPIGGYYKNMDAFMKEPSLPTRFLTLDPQGGDKRAAGQFLVAYRQGRHGDFGNVPQKMLAYAREHEISFEGPVYTLYLLDGISVVDSSKYLVRIAAGVTKNK